MRLEVDHVSKRFVTASGTVQALQDVDFQVEPGEFVSIVGPSGCGKSTLLEIVAGLSRPTEGAVRIGGQEVRGPHPAVGVVFQEDSTFPWLTVQANVEFGLRMHGVPRPEAAKRVREMLRLVGLEGFESHYPDQLSGGMRQRVAIARVLVMRPSIILMDEPFGALDEQTRLVLGEELLRLWHETGCTILFVTHSLSEAAMLSDRVVVMTARPGRVAEIIDVDLPRPRTSDVIGTPAFTEVTRRIWRHLHAEARRMLQLDDTPTGGEARKAAGSIRSLSGASWPDPSPAHREAGEG